jgi:hypothetical protein
MLLFGKISIEFDKTRKAATNVVKCVEKQFFFDPTEILFNLYFLKEKM